MIDVPTRVKDALREGDRLKRYRFVVDSDPVITITNDNLVSESVTFDERMCSDKEIKFGLCEGTNLEFQYFGLPNITGKRLQAFIDVQYKDSDGVVKWYEIPMGWFEVSESSRQASTGIIKVSAFNKLQSDYLDNDAQDQIIELATAGDSGYAGQITMHNLLCDLLQDYAIDQAQHESIIDLTGSQSSISGEFNIRIYDQRTHQVTNTYLWVWIDLFEIVGPTYQSDEFYEVRLDVKKFEDYIATINSGINDMYNNIWVADGANPYCSLGDFIERHFYLPNGNDPAQVGAIGYSGGILGMDKDTPSSVVSPLVPPSNQYIRYQSTPFYRYWDEAQESQSITYNSKRVIGLYPADFNHSYSGFCFAVPRIIAIGNSSSTPPYNINNVPMLDNIVSAFDITMDRVIVTPIEKQDVTASNFSSSVTIRDLQSAVFEIDCQYGKLDRTTDLFSGVELNNSRLLPAEDLYPANDLYPNSIAERSNPAMYSKLWADEGNVRKFRYLIITYKGTETEGGQTREVEKTLQRTVDENGTDDYNMSDNWLFKNLVWTDEEIEDYADAMVAKMQNLTWFPFEMWCAGLPYVETGDELEINVNGEAYTSYVLRRNLRGIQNLQDEMINGELDIF